MRIEREQYEEWRKRWSDINETITSENDNWAAAVAGFLHQIESARCDAYLTGLAKTALRLASEVRKPKRNVLPCDAFQAFLNAWIRVDGAIGMHLMERPDQP